MFIITPAANGATLAGALASIEGQPVSATETDLLEQVQWLDNPEPVYFQCRDRRGNISLELWYSADSRAQGKGQEPQPLLAGTLGPLLVLSYFNEEGRPAKGIFLITPSGTTHLFRVNNAEHLADASITWECEKYGAEGGT